MYDFFTGRVASKSPTSVVLDVGGVGYRLEIPVSTYERLQDAGERPVRVFAYLHVRDDALKLYGFASEAERRLFEALLSVKGIGPVIALHVLSGSGVADTVRAIKDGDTRALHGLKGVGKKTAERIVLELKDKADHLMPSGGAPLEGMR
jgi:Holliday junction DNA helicase RuvA